MARKILGLAVLLVLSLTMGLPQPAAAALGCADYISGNFANPKSGTLRGTETINETWHIGAGAGSGTRGISGSGGYSRSTTYEVGTYELNDGTFVRLDCRDYSYYRLM